MKKISIAWAEDNHLFMSTVFELMREHVNPILDVRTSQ